MSRRTLATLAATFWVLVLAIVVLFAFFVALGAFSPTDAIWATIAVGVLCALWVVHAVLEGRRHERRDPATVRARERRGF
jgi:membrane protein YdbS with pleckstrin-like domain